MSAQSLEPDPRLPDGPAAALDAETTVALLARVRAGDEGALHRLLERCLPPLTRWAHGRLPPSVGDLGAAADIVQDTVTAALRRLGPVTPCREAALQAHLRQAVARRIVHITGNRHAGSIDVPGHRASEDASQLDRAIGAENIARFDAALDKLHADDREAVVCRLELRYSYGELAIALDQPTPSAARAAVLRALRRLEQEMQHDGSGSPEDRR